MNNKNADMLWLILSMTLIMAVPSPSCAKNRIEILPMLTVSQVYEDNIFLESSNERSDYLTMISPQIRANISSKSNWYKLYYAPTFVYYHDYDEKNTVRHWANLDIRQSFGDFSHLDITDKYLNTEEPFEIDRETQTVRRSRNVYERNDATVAFNYAIGTSDQITFGYQHSILENEDPVLDDAIQQNLFANFEYGLKSANTVFLNVKYTDSEFNRDDGHAPGDDFDGYRVSTRLNHRIRRPTIAFVSYDFITRHFKGNEEDYDIHDFGLGMSHDFSANTSVSGEIGYFIQDRERTGDTNGLRFSVNLRKKIDRGNVSVGASTGQTEEYLEATRRGFTRYRAANGRVNYRLTKNVESYALFTYRQDDDITGLEDETYRTQVGLRTDFYQWYRASLYYSYWERNSNIPNDEYEDNRITLEVSGSRLFRSAF